MSGQARARERDRRTGSNQHGEARGALSVVLQSHATVISGSSIRSMRSDLFQRSRGNGDRSPYRGSAAATNDLVGTLGSAAQPFMEGGSWRAR
jgi:hypothetical protein